MPMAKHAAYKYLLHVDGQALSSRCEHGTGLAAQIKANLWQAPINEMSRAQRCSGFVLRRAMLPHLSCCLIICIKQLFGVAAAACHALPLLHIKNHPCVAAIRFLPCQRGCTLRNANAVAAFISFGLGLTC